MRISFDLSEDSFRRWGPDHPEQVDWDKVLPGGLFFARVSSSALTSIVNQNSVSLNPQVIKRDIDKSKWVRLEAAVRKGIALTPSWGVLDKGGRLFIAQGRHRFQYLVVHKAPAVVVGVSGMLRQHLQKLGVVSEFFAPGYVTHDEEM